MPRVPVLDQPSEQVTPLQAPQQQAPGPAAFGRGATEGVVQAAGEVESAANQAWAIAIRQQASEGGLVFLKAAIKSRSNYIALHGEKAVKGYPEVTDALEKAFNDGKNSINSIQGRNEYIANAESNLRREQSVIETHFAAERQRYRLQTYKDTMSAGTADLATLATMNKDGMTTKAMLDVAQSKVQSLRDTAVQEAMDRGVDPANMENFVTREMRVPLTGFLDALTHTKHPALKEAVETYGAALQKGPSGSTYKVLNEMEVSQRAGKILSALPHIDTDRQEDDHGFIPNESVITQLAAIPEEDPNKAKIAKAVWDGWEKERTRFIQAGTELEDIVSRQGNGRGKNGGWDIPRDSLDWQNFERLYPTRALKIAGRVDRHLAIDVKQENVRGRGQALEDFERMDPEDQKVQKYAQIASLVRTYAPAATGEDIDKTWKRVQEIQSGKGDEVSKRASTIVQKGLRAAFGRDEAMIGRYAGMARAFVDDQHEGDKALKEEDLITKLQNEAPNWVGGIFKKAKPYERNHPVAPPPPRPEPKAEKPDQILTIKGKKYNVTKKVWVDE